MPEQKEQNDSASLLWGGTLFVAIFIVGLCVFIALGNKKPADEPALVVAAVQLEQQEVPPFVVEARPRPVAPPEVISPVVEAPPEIVIEDTGPPELLLDNLAGTLMLEVPFLKIRNKMPLEHSCYRDNRSPALNWDGAPAETKSFVVFLEKRGGAEEGFTNWILFNIPGELSSLSKGRPKKPELADGSKHANSDHNNIGYIGPCDSKGKFTYALRVFALDSILDLKPYTSKDDLIRAMNGHIIDAAEREFIHYYRL